MERDSYEHGVPSWVDLGTPDPEAAAIFYGELLGWDVEQGPPEAGGYAMATLRGRLVAGLGPAQNPGPPYWSVYVNVDDADAIASAVDANGGKAIVPPMDVLTAGRMAIFADPSGAVFGVWQPREHKGAQLVEEPGAMCWTELMTSDVDGAKRFYGAVFGWGTEDSDMGGQTYTTFQVDGRSIGGMMAKGDNVPAEVPPNWGVYFAVDDTDAAVRLVRERGGQVYVEPTDIEPGRFAMVADPQGAAFGVIQQPSS